MAYLDMFVGPVADDAREAYRTYAAAMNALTLRAGALSASAYWGVDSGQGMLNPLAKAVKVEAGETIVSRIVRWSSKAARDEGLAAMMKMPDMQTVAALFQLDRSRVLYAGFEELGAE